MNSLVHAVFGSSLNLANIVGADTRWAIAWMFFFTAIGFFVLKNREAARWSQMNEWRWQAAFRMWLAFGGCATLALLLFEPIHLVIWLPAFGTMLDRLLRNRCELKQSPQKDAGIESTPKSA